MVKDIDTKTKVFQCPTDDDEGNRGENRGRRDVQLEFAEQWESTSDYPRLGDRRYRTRSERT